MSKRSIFVERNLVSKLLALRDWQQSAVMGRSLPIMVTKRSGQMECKRVVKWSAVFQLVFQRKIKIIINIINQEVT
jgi:hypothetical protein